METKIPYPLEIFYDGNCILCSTEINIYRKHNAEGRFEFIDISAPGFKAETYGRTYEQFMEQMHVRDGAGNYFLGVEAFLTIWKAYPSGSFYPLLASLVSLPVISHLARGGYFLFARYRHLLPKYRKSCDSGSCDLHRRDR